MVDFHRLKSRVEGAKKQGYIINFSTMPPKFHSASTATTKLMDVLWEQNANHAPAAARSLTLSAVLQGRLEIPAGFM